mgnify:CR=1 FL=1
MMTYDYDVKRNAYHRDSCKTVADFSSLIIGGLDKLKATGHPKWKTVDLTALPPGCAFAPRCGHAQPECRQPVALEEKAQGHLSACIFDFAGAA